MDKSKKILMDQKMLNLKNWFNTTNKSSKGINKKMNSNQPHRIFHRKNQANAKAKPLKLMPKMTIVFTKEKWNSLDKVKLKINFCRKENKYLCNGSKQPKEILRRKLSSPEKTLPWKILEINRKGPLQGKAWWHHFPIFTQIKAYLGTTLREVLFARKNQLKIYQ